MRYDHFRVNRPVGTGHSRPNDVKRTRRALNETGHGSSPPTPSGHYNSGAIDMIARFQRDFGLKPDAIILPGGPTERVLDLALAAKRDGGPEAMEQLRDALAAFSQAGFKFEPLPEDDDRPGRLVDRAGHEVGPDRLLQILQQSAGGRQKAAAPDPTERPTAPGPAAAVGTAAGQAARGLLPRFPLGIPAVPPFLWPLIGLGFAFYEQTQRTDPETVAAERNAATAPILERAARQRARREGKPVGRTIEGEAGPHILPGPTIPPNFDTSIPPFPGEPPEGLKDKPGEAPRFPEQAHILPGKEIKPIKPEPFIYQALSDEDFRYQISIVFNRPGDPRTRAGNHALGERTVYRGEKAGRKLKVTHGGYNAKNVYRPELYIPPAESLQVPGSPTRNSSYPDVVIEDEETGRRLLINTQTRRKDGTPIPNEALQERKILLNKNTGDLFWTAGKPLPDADFDEYAKQYDDVLDELIQELAKPFPGKKKP